jgi:hypothetical protein
MKHIFLSMCTGRQERIGNFNYVGVFYHFVVPIVNILNKRLKMNKKVRTRSKTLFTIMVRVVDSNMVRVVEYG